MSVILVILKIIGIMLLVVLGLFLLILLSILLIPARYRFSGEAQEEISGGVRINWLFHLIYFRTDLEHNEFSMKLCILGIPLRLGEKAPKEKMRKKNIRKKKRGHIKKAKEDPDGSSGLMQEQKEKPETEDTGRVPDTGADLENSNTEKQLPFQPEQKAEHKIRNNRKKRGRLRNWIQKIKNGMKALKKLPERIKYRCKNLNETISNIKVMITDETNKSAIGVLYREFKILVRHASPRKARGELQFGTNDPALTGQITGAFSIFPFIYRYQVRILPDFQAESFYARGFLELRGYVRGIHFLMIVFRLLRDKNIRSMIQKYRK